MQPVGAPRGDSHIPADTDTIVRGSKLLEEMRDHIRRKHYSIRTEQAYLDWARHILFHGKRHPTEMGEHQTVALLNHLAVERGAAASTQNQSLNALRRERPCDLASARPRSADSAPDGCGEPTAWQRPSCRTGRGLPPLRDEQRADGRQESLGPAGRLLMLPGFVDAMLTQRTLQPGQKGTKRLIEKYGDRLVCARYRLDLESGRRHTTVELIEEETELQSRPQGAPSNDHFPLPALSSGQRLGVRVEYCESELREKVKAAGGIWRPPKTSGSFPTKP